jgi:hypothetical protein
MAALLVLSPMTSPVSTAMVLPSALAARLLPNQL